LARGTDTSAKIGKMTLNQNVNNFFAEKEQVAFSPGNVVPGIDFTNDSMCKAGLSIIFGQADIRK